MRSWRHYRPRSPMRPSLFGHGSVNHRLPRSDHWSKLASPLQNRRDRGAAAGRLEPARVARLTAPPPLTTLRAMPIARPFLAATDPEIAALVGEEERRQADKIRLIPS